MPKFMDTNYRTVSESEVTNLFRYEDFLKEFILKNGVGQIALDHLKNVTLKKVYIVPSAN